MSAEEDLPTASIIEYNGGVVDLSDFWLEHPVVYNLETMELAENVPVLYLHKYDSEVGHLTNQQKSSTNLTSQATFSVPGEHRDKITQAIANGFSYQSSMGIRVNWEKLTLYMEGSVVVNGQTFQAPVYVFDGVERVECTITPVGRDNSTSVTLTNEDENMIRNGAKKAGRRRITNSDPQPHNLTPPEGTSEPPAEPVVPNTPEPVPPVAPAAPTPPVVPNNGPPTSPPIVPNTPNPQSATAAPGVGNDPRFDLYMERIENHPGQAQLVRQSIQNGWSDEELNRQVMLTNSRPMPRLPGMAGRGDQVENEQAVITAQLGRAMGARREALANSLGEETVDLAFQGRPVGLRETLAVVSNHHGGQFSGHSDWQDMARHLRQVNNMIGLQNTIQNTMFSQISFTGALDRVTQIVIEDRWEMDEALEVSMAHRNPAKDFRPSERVRLGGGSMWQPVDDHGKIRHANFGPTQKYQTHLDTVAQILMITRQMMINDDIGAIADMLDAMVEGAEIVPQYKFWKTLYGMATNDKFKLEDKNYFELELTDENLETVYVAASERLEKRGEVEVQANPNTRFTLAVPRGLERNAWEIVNQERLVNRTRSAETAGDQNYWKDRLDVQVFPNMSNKTFHPLAASNNWALLPQNTRLSPLSVSYLDGIETPTTEIVPSDADMLGEGVRGYFDVEMDLRENEFFALSIPGGAGTQKVKTKPSGIQNLRK